MWWITSSCYYISTGLRSFPDVLSYGNASIVQNSIVFLYCAIHSFSPTLKLSWIKDNLPLVPNIPHVRIRKSTSRNYKTLLLVVDSFQKNDDGRYWCIAEDWGYMVNGNSFNLTGILVVQLRGTCPTFSASIRTATFSYYTP